MIPETNHGGKKDLVCPECLEEDFEVVPLTFHSHPCGYDYYGCETCFKKKRGFYKLGDSGWMTEQYTRSNVLATYKKLKKRYTRVVKKLENL